MHTTETWNKFQRGFTLLELLAVVLVVGLMVSLIVVNIERDDDKLAYMEAKRFVALLRHLQDESVLQGLVMGVVIDSSENNYHFLVQKEQWQTVADDDVLRERQLPDSVRLSIVFSEQKTSENGNVKNFEIDSENFEEPEESIVFPQITVEPYGLTSPFTLGFTGSSRSYRVRSDQDQDIVIDKQS